MRISSLPALLALFLASLMPALVARLFATAQTNYSIQYQVREALKTLSGGPWQGVVFGFCFGTVVHFFSQEHNRVSKEEVFAFTLLCALIQVTLQYFTILVSSFLSIAHIHPMIFVSGMSALFIALIAWKGLYINLNGFGVFLTTLLGIGIAVLATTFTGLPFDILGHWYTIIGTFIALFSAFDRV